MLETGPWERVQTARRKHTPEQTIKKLRQAEMVIAEGNTVAEASRKIGVTDQTFDGIRPHSFLG